MRFSAMMDRTIKYWIYELEMPEAVKMEINAVSRQKRCHGCGNGRSANIQHPSGHVKFLPVIGRIHNAI